MTAAKPAPAPKAASNAKSALIWGGLAFCCILAVGSLVVLRIGPPSYPIITARVSTTPPPAQPVIQKPQGASEFEVARLNDAIRDLASERDRLAARVETLEQSVGDITASISAAKKPAVAAPETQKPEPQLAKAPEPAAGNERPNPSASPAPSAPTPAPKPQSFFPLTTPPITDAAKAAADEPVPPAEERSHAHMSPVGKVERPGRVAKTATPLKTKHYKTRMHKELPPPLAAKPAFAPPQPVAASGPQTQIAHILPQQQPEVTGAMKTEFGVDLGGETSLDGLRARWASIKGNHGAALEGLHPLVRVREGSRPGTVELHLVAGPLANAGTAARVCASLQNKGITCRASEFDGQRLSLH